MERGCFTTVHGPRERRLRYGVLCAAAGVLRAGITAIPRDGEDDVADSYALDAPSAWGSVMFRDRHLVHLAATVR